MAAWVPISRVPTLADARQGIPLRPGNDQFPTPAPVCFSCIISVCIDEDVGTWGRWLATNESLAACRPLHDWYEYTVGFFRFF